MTKTKSQLNNKDQELLSTIEGSDVIPLLISSYQKALRNLVYSNQIALKRTLQTLLKQEKPNDLQTQYFLEETLEKFVQDNLKISLTPEQLRLEFATKAEKLIRAFLFFDTEQKNQIIPYLNRLPLEGLHHLINLFREGHRKQSEYLNIFVEKDPKIAIKFEVIASGSLDRVPEHNAIKTTDQK